MKRSVRVRCFGAMTGVFALFAAGSPATPLLADAPVVRGEDAVETPYVRPDVAAYLKASAAHPIPPLTAEVLAHIRKLPPGAMPSRDLPVVSVEYRLAPESPWPAAPDDGEAAARWVAANGKALGREVTGLVLSGDSAGGNLTLIVAAALRDKSAAVPVILQVPIYPATDFVGHYASQRQFGNGYGLDDSATALFRKHYAGDPQSPRVSPLLDNLKGLPPTVLVTAGLDPLRDQGRAYAAKLVEAGVPTAYFEGKGLVHGFATFRKDIPSAQRDTEAFLAVARTMLDELRAK